MTRKSPAFSFYPDSWFGGTLTMPPMQRAAYIDLLGLQWVSGGFSRQDATLACRGISDADVHSVLESKFEEVEPNRFLNARLEEERKKQADRAEIARKNGRKGGRPKTQTKPKGKAKHNPKEKLSVSVSDSIDELSMCSPNVDQVQEYIDAQKPLNPGTPWAFTGQEFCDKYDAVGWVDGNGIPIRDWKAMARKWAKDPARNRMGKTSSAKTFHQQKTENTFSAGDRFLNRNRSIAPAIGSEVNRAN